jgi:FlaA1/EpsC-like NDP-sugar epimerase
VELAERMIRMRGLRPYVDIEIKFTGARPGEKLHEALHADSEIPQPTLHPDIFQLTDRCLKLEPTAFLCQLDDLRTVQIWDDDRLRLRLTALAHLNQTGPEMDGILRALPGHVAGWVVSPGVGESAGTQRQVPFSS